MKIATMTFTISLGLLAIFDLPTLAAESQDWQIELQQMVRGLWVDKLFTEHQLPQTMKEFSYAKEAYNKGEEMLDNGQGIKALPYLAYAERYMVPESLTTLERVGGGFYEGVRESVQDQIKQALSTYNSEFSKYNNQGSIFKTYVYYWNENEKNLRKSQEASFFGSFKKFIFRETPSFPNTKPMPSISSEALFGKQSRTSPYSSSREGTVEDMIPLLPGELDKKMQ
ncbi:MAG: hypothetical protein K0M45_04360 [Candidatus Paracaedibacteraceae bacterium]|nr:hypothetical protein [Candidatus Paracaedibacteraceae bacterium]